MTRFITAKTFPLDPETGKFRSDPAEAAFVEAMEQGIDVSRDELRSVIQAYQLAQDKCAAELEKWKEANEP